MKSTNVFLYILAALLLFAGSGCSSEEEAPRPEEPRVEGELRFSFPGTTRKSVTYGGIAVDKENQLDSLVVYMFKHADDASGTLERIFRYQSSDLLDPTGTGAAPEVKLEINGRSGTYVFLFVANGNGCTSALDGVSLGQTTEQEVIETMTDALTGRIADPLLMSCRKKIEDVQHPADDDKKVQLIRRMARFDIINDATKSNFRIDSILISGAKDRANIFGDAPAGSSNPAPAPYTLPAINTGILFDNGGTPTDSLSSVFYLYPTKLGSGETQISLEGVFKGEKKVYNLKATNFQIEPNKRYILRAKAMKDNEPDIDIEFDPWDNWDNGSGSSDGSAHYGEPDGDIIAMTPFTVTTGNGQLLPDGKTYDITAATAESTLSLTTTSYNAEGSSYVLTYEEGDETVMPINITRPDPVLTYAASYVQEYSIVIPRQTNKQKAKAKLEIINNTDTNQRETFYIESDGDNSIEVGALTKGSGNGTLTGDTYNVTGASNPGTLTFTVKSYNSLQKVEITKTYTVGDESGLPGITINNPDPVFVDNETDPHYTQTCEVSVPQQTNHVPVTVTIEVKNTEIPSETRTFYIKSDGIPKYPGTNLFAVKVGNLYWAPVNVGATTITYSDTEAYMGQYFQWGRNVAFPYKGDVTTQPGPVSGESSTTAGKFITNNDDWLSPKNDALWSNGKQQGPCPAGWRVPTKNDLQKLVDAPGRTWEAGSKRWSIKSDDGKSYLYLPAAGSRNRSDGSVGNQGSAGYYWSSGVDGANASYLGFTSSTFSMRTNNRALGYSVRCVQ